MHGRPSCPMHPSLQFASPWNRPPAAVPLVPRPDDLSTALRSRLQSLQGAAAGPDIIWQLQQAAQQTPFGGAYPPGQLQPTPFGFPAQQAVPQQTTFSKGSPARPPASLTPPQPELDLAAALRSHIASNPELEKLLLEQAKSGPTEGEEGDSSGDKATDVASADAKAAVKDAEADGVEKQGDAPGVAADAEDEGSAAKAPATDSAAPPPSNDDGAATGASEAQGSKAAADEGASQNEKPEAEGSSAAETADTDKADAATQAEKAADPGQGDGSRKRKEAPSDEPEAKRPLVWPPTAIEFVPEALEAAAAAARAAKGESDVSSTTAKGVVEAAARAALEAMSQLGKLPQEAAASLRPPAVDEAKVEASDKPPQEVERATSGPGVDEPKELNSESAAEVSAPEPVPDSSGKQAETSDAGGEAVVAAVATAATVPGAAEPAVMKAEVTAATTVSSASEVSPPTLLPAVSSPMTTAPAQLPPVAPFPPLPAQATAVVQEEPRQAVPKAPPQGPLQPPPLQSPPPPLPVPPPLPQTTLPQLPPQQAALTMPPAQAQGLGNLAQVLPAGGAMTALPLLPGMPQVAKTNGLATHHLIAFPPLGVGTGADGAESDSRVYRFSVGPGHDIEACIRSVRRRIEVELDDGCTVQMTMVKVGR